MFQYNIYYHPEKVDLEIIESVDSAGAYEFRILAVWRDKQTGNLYYARDSGCSCPSPFEWVTGVRDLNPINEHTFDRFADDLREHLKQAGDAGSDVLHNVRAALIAQGKG